jgi:hypothetical protein
MIFLKFVVKKKSNKEDFVKGDQGTLSISLVNFETA